MGLNSALVDRARIVSKDEAGRVVDGETIYAESTGPWFKARIQLGTEGESPATPSARKVDRTPSMLVALRDEEGNTVTLTIENRVEYDSAQLPEASTIWDVIADPQPIRKKRTVIGFQVTLRKAVVHSRAS